TGNPLSDCHGTNADEAPPRLDWDKRILRIRPIATVGRSHGEGRSMKKNLIVGAAIGDCVHVAGVVNFLNLAEQLCYETVCLGPAISVDAVLNKVVALDPEIVAVGYRLTPENCRNLLNELTAKATARGQ